MQSGSYEKATGTIYGWSSNEHASLPIDTRFNSALHSCWDIAMIRMTASLLDTPLLTTSQSKLLRIIAERATPLFPPSVRKTPRKQPSPQHSKADPHTSSHGGGHAECAI